MKSRLLLILFSLAAYGSLAQENPVVEQQVENITEADESETEDDTYLQSLRQYSRNRLNINAASEAELREFVFLTPLQIANLLTHRRIMGKLLNVYELQAVPGWDYETIQRILPYIMVGPAVSAVEDFAARFRGGEHSLLGRVTYTLEEQRGFARRRDTAASSFYAGSRERVFMRYKYVYKNLLQYGITAEKDPGEQWFKGAQRNGFDFYSAHLFVRNLGIVKQLAIGDFTVNMGQGLIQWQALAFRKSVEVTNIKRQASILRPYNSPGEYFFKRGVGITIGKGSWQATAFASFRRIDGNVQLASDTMQAEDFFASINTMGLRRTVTEQARRNQVQMHSFGGNVSYNKNNLHMGANAIHFQFSLPFNRQDQPYNNFVFRGSRLTNISIDWAYTWRNVHWFGEIANHNQIANAITSGMLVSADPKVDFSLVYRNMDPRYQTIFGNAFTEGTQPTNERGLFLGTSIRPNPSWRLDAFMDVYRFPWLRFRIDAPSYGREYIIQLTHRPSKQIEVYTRYRFEGRALNYNPDNRFAEPIISEVPRQNWRTQFQYKVNASITLRQRLDAMWFDIGGPRESRGFLAFFDVFYKPMLKPLSANLRLQYFETDNFDSRIYAFENDVLYSFSIPAFFNKGYRYYTNINYDFSKKLTVWLRFSQFIFIDRSTIGSGLDEIPGNTRSDVRLQFLYRF